MNHLNEKLINIVKQRFKNSIENKPKALLYGLKQKNLYFTLSPLLFYTYENYDCGRCRDCGRNVHDFHVEDDLWEKVIGQKNGVWCYDCFVDKARKKGVLTHAYISKEIRQFDSNW